MITTSRRDLKLVADELKEVVPEAMHSMLEKQAKDEAIQKHLERKQKETVICPPTCSGKKVLSIQYSPRVFQTIFLKALKFTAALTYGSWIVLRLLETFTL